MANSDSPNGFWPLAAPGGNTPGVQKFTVSSTYASAIGKGSPVALGPLGPIRWAAGNTALIGVAQNFVTSATGTGAKGDLFVYTDPNQLFHVQTDDNTVTTLAGFQGNCFSLTNPGGYNTTTLQSIAEIDGNTGASASTTVIFQVHDVYGRVDQIVNQSFTRVYGKFVPAVHLYAKASPAAI